MPGTNAGLSRHGVVHARAGLGVRGARESTRRVDTRKRLIHACEGVSCLWLLDDSIDRIVEVSVLHDEPWLLIATAKDGEPVRIRPFDGTTFSPGDFRPRLCAYSRALDT